MGEVVEVKAWASTATHRDIEDERFPEERRAPPPRPAGSGAEASAQGLVPVRLSRLRLLFRRDRKEKTARMITRQVLDVAEVAGGDLLQPSRRRTGPVMRIETLVGQSRPDREADVLFEVGADTPSQVRVGEFPVDFGDVRVEVGVIVVLEGVFFFAVESVDFLQQTFLVSEVLLVMAIERTQAPGHRPRMRVGIVQAELRAEAEAAVEAGREEVDRTAANRDFGRTLAVARRDRQVIDHGVVAVHGARQEIEVLLDDVALLGFVATHREAEFEIHRDATSEGPAAVVAQLRLDLSGDLSAERLLISLRHLLRLAGRPARDQGQR